MTEGAFVALPVLLMAASCLQKAENDELGFGVREAAEVSHAACAELAVWASGSRACACMLTVVLTLPHVVPAMMEGPQGYYSNLRPNLKAAADEVSDICHHAAAKAVVQILKGLLLA